MTYRSLIATVLSVIVVVMYLAMVYEEVRYLGTVELLGQLVLSAFELDQTLQVL